MIQISILVLMWNEHEINLTDNIAWASPHLFHKTPVGINPSFYPSHSDKDYYLRYFSHTFFPKFNSLNVKGAIM